MEDVRELAVRVDQGVDDLVRGRGRLPGRRGVRGRIHNLPETIGRVRLGLERGFGRSPTREDPGMAGRIVVGVDGTEESAAALRWAMEEAALREAEVEAVHAWSYTPLAAPADAGLVPLGWTEGTEAVVAVREAAERVVREQVRGIAGDDGRISITVVQGEAAHALIEAAEGADLLVVGNRGRGAFAQALFGSTSARVSDKAHCPVVVVRHDDAA